MIFKAKKLYCLVLLTFSVMTLVGCQPADNVVNDTPGVGMTDEEAAAYELKMEEDAKNYEKAQRDELINAKKK